MTNILKIFSLALVLVTGTVATSGIALAGPDGAYHWAYPDNLKSSSNSPQGVGSGIPAQYR